MFASGTSVVFDDARVTVRLPAAVSASPTVKAIGPVAVSSFVVRSAISEMVGAVLAPATVTTTNVSVAVSFPSLTVTVIVVVPD